MWVMSKQDIMPQEEKVGDSIYFVGVYALTTMHFQW